MPWEAIPGYMTRFGSDDEPPAFISGSGTGNGAGGTTTGNDNTLLGAGAQQGQNRGETGGGGTTTNGNINGGLGPISRADNLLTFSVEAHWGPVGNVHDRSNMALRIRRQMAYDEERKRNIRMFGATWLKPPGVHKTLQQMLDEAAEREEQARMLEQAEEEAAALEAQEEGNMTGDVTGDGTGNTTGNGGTPPNGTGTAATAAGVTDGQNQQNEGADEFEHDLDDDIPDAISDDGFPDDGDDSEDYDAAEYFVGSQDVEEEDEEEEGVLVSPVRDEEVGEVEMRHLDEDVPEGGSYQHTDTEYEDVSEVGVRADDGSSQMGGAAEVVRGGGSSVMTQGGRQGQPTRVGAEVRGNNNSERQRQRRQRQTEMVVHEDDTDDEVAMMEMEEEDDEDGDEDEDAMDEDEEDEENEHVGPVNPGPHDGSSEQ